MQKLSSGDYLLDLESSKVTESQLQKLWSSCIILHPHQPTKSQTIQSGVAL